ncbi:UbiA family prenyltransferase [Paenibacillus rhizovicinus]|uniref:4-hydroxybenzoate polyprenyltransferase n=1 Tax=Paenibacillus rhizovicinus TaxID=2704463 RepID=A0A6C0NVH4_9BACL|nr:UbiA-like polyprenyltransferase [Paenibacillus rhizovicinus]QHW30189.1 UbiA family prenyltransferase [Paenibacillus rhizovicinus]
MIRKTRIILEMIKVEHTIFALPFAFMGAMLGAVMMEGRMPSWAEIGWILLAMVGARSAAMGLNRVVDRVIDAKNPRTAKRAIPAGLLKAGEVVVFIAVSFVVLFIAASQLDPICMKLMPIAVFFLVLYSYTKRFTWLCHVVLGITIGLAPLGGWIAITGSLEPGAWVLYGSVVCWLAGFDTIYACQDFEFDRRERVFSIPARFGLKNALQIARGFHFLTAVGFISLYWLTDLSWIYLIGAVASVGFLWYEHLLVKPNDISRVQTAFFTMNGALSITLFAFTLLDLVVLHEW